jgi:sulfotransferase family protein
MLRVVGAGLPRTATHTLKLALPMLIGGRCYHMTEVLDRPEHVPLWQHALDGGSPDWDQIFEGYSAAVDWPTSAFWLDIAETFPSSLILLSVRTDGEAWWRSVDNSIMDDIRSPESRNDWWEMACGLWRRTLGPEWNDPAANAAAYEHWVSDVRRTAPPDRLLEWQPRDGWAPLCEALSVHVPDAPLPHVNTASDYEERRRKA